MRSRSIPAALLVLAVAAPAAAADPTGEEIMRKAREFQFPENTVADVRMILTNKRGQERVRHIKMFRKTYDDGNSKMLARFLEPADVKGTGFLIWQNDGGDDDMFMYLPSLKKVRRLSADDDEASFMGSDFANGDLKLREVEDDSHALVGSDTVAKKDCFVVESIPKPGNDNLYSKSRSWVRKDNFVPIKVELFRKGDGKHVKTMYVRKTSVIDGKLTVTHMLMRDEKKQSQTDMVLDNITIDDKIDDALFTKATLERP